MFILTKARDLAGQVFRTARRRQLNLLLAVAAASALWLAALYWLERHHLFTASGRGDHMEPPTATEDPRESMRNALGREADDFEVRDLDGYVFRLSDAQGVVPVVIEFGSFT
jgi:hypothetical protein